MQRTGGPNCLSLGAFAFGPFNRAAGQPSLILSPSLLETSASAGLGKRTSSKPQLGAPAEELVARPFSAPPPLAPPRPPAWLLSAQFWKRRTQGNAHVTPILQALITDEEASCTWLLVSILTESKAGKHVCKEKPLSSQQRFDNRAFFPHSKEPLLNEPPPHQLPPKQLLPAQATPVSRA